jgi:drug/metabolite transporter (DMT)-like permease
MAVFLSLLTAALFGTGDFCGGLAARRAPISQVVGGSHAIGLTGSFVAAVLLADEFAGVDFLLGMAAGVFGGVGVALLYRGLGRGPMSIVAPLTAITSAAVPAVWGVADGDTLSLWAWVGVAIALAAIGMVSISNDNTDTPVTRQVVGEALLAGAAFGVFFIFMDATDGASAPWPVVGSRLITTVAILGYLLLRRRPIIASTSTAIWLIVATGIFDTASNILFLYATIEGQLSVVSVLSSLYPVATVILARAILHERMTRIQLSGCVAALAASVLIAIG